MSDWSKTANSVQRAAESDVRSTGEAVKSSARAAAQTVKDSASDAYARTSDLVRDGAGRVADASGATADSLIQQIRSQPVTAAVIGLGIGFIAGILMARRS